LPHGVKEFVSVAKLMYVLYFTCK